MRGPADYRPRARSDDIIVERLPGETLVYDQSRDTAHCLGEVAAAVLALCDGTRTRGELAAIAAQRLGRPFGEADVDAVLSELRGNALLDEEPTRQAMSRRQVLLAGGGVAAASLITTIVAPVPAAAQSPGPPGGNTCQQDSDCQTFPVCQNGMCCAPENAPCNSDADCCGNAQNPFIECFQGQGSPFGLCEDNTPVP